MTSSPTFHRGMGVAVVAFLADRIGPALIGGAS
jgi:hypothetical protein